jgi:diaminopimelate decarboxylase
LYNAHHDVINLTNQNEPNNKFDIVGPICETGDFLAEDRLLTADENDLIAILDAGAYGFSMSSNYNSRPRISEVMVNNDQFTLIRDRESFEDLIKHEIKHLNT